MAALIALSYVSLVHSIENGANGSVPGFVRACVFAFVLEYVWVKVCVRQKHQLRLIGVGLPLHRPHPPSSAPPVSWSVGIPLSMARPHVPASLITRGCDSLIECGQFMNIF